MSNYFPIKPHVKIQRRGSGWIAKLFNFFGEMVDSAEAKTRDEAYIGVA